MFTFIEGRDSLSQAQDESYEPIGQTDKTPEETPDNQPIQKPKKITRRDALGKIFRGVAAAAVGGLISGENEAGAETAYEKSEKIYDRYVLKIDPPNFCRILDSRVLKEYNINPGMRNYVLEEVRKIEVRFEVEQRDLINERDHGRKNNDSSSLRHLRSLNNQLESILETLYPESGEPKKGVVLEKDSKEIVEKRILNWALKREADKATEKLQNYFANVKTPRDAEAVEEKLRKYKENYMIGDARKMWDKMAAYNFPLSRELVINALENAFKRYTDKAANVKKFLSDRLK